MVSRAMARRAAGVLAAYARAGVLGRDPEFRAAVADLCRFAEQEESAREEPMGEPTLMRGEAEVQEAIRDLEARWQGRGCRAAHPDAHDTFAVALAVLRWVAGDRREWFGEFLHTVRPPREASP